MNQLFDISKLDAWDSASQQAISRSLGIALELRSYQLSPSQTLENAFNDVNKFPINSFSSSLRRAIIALAKETHSATSQTLSFVITRVEANADSPGLRMDLDRLKIYALGNRPGARSFTGALYQDYLNNPDTRHLAWLMGYGFPRVRPRRWFLLTIPAEDKAKAEKFASQHGMFLTAETPPVAALDPDGVLSKVQYPEEGLPNVLYLVNEADSAIYKSPQAGQELFKIETMMLKDTDVKSEES